MQTPCLPRRGNAQSFFLALWKAWKTRVTAFLSLSKSLKFILFAPCGEAGFSRLRREKLGNRCLRRIVSANAAYGKGKREKAKASRRLSSLMMWRSAMTAVMDFGSLGSGIHRTSPVSSPGGKRGKKRYGIHRLSSRVFQTAYRPARVIHGFHTPYYFYGILYKTTTTIR